MSEPGTPRWVQIEADVAQILVDVFDDSRARYLFDAVFHAKIAEASKRIAVVLGGPAR